MREMGQRPLMTASSGRLQGQMFWAIPVRRDIDLVLVVVVDEGAFAKPWRHCHHCEQSARRQDAQFELRSNIDCQQSAGANSSYTTDAMASRTRIPQYLSAKRPRSLKSVLYLDRQLLVLNKPPGLVCQGGKSKQAELLY